MTTLGIWQKSSFSGSGDGNNCLELTATFKALYLRESDAPATILTTTRAPLAHLLAGIQADTVSGPTPAP
ncbi:DUF397 domain-containing protein [Streptomyces antibioticus]|uniref:DUF397 domain-containing protein n=1 Tax=Streptomyces antibioticus TaxID=1890 RepID=UPI0036C199DF